MTNGWVQGNQECRYLQPDHFGDQDVYCEATHEPEDVLYIGSDDDEYESPAERRQRIEAQGRRYLQGKRLHLISASLSGPFTKASGWTNPWRSKSVVRKSSKRKRPTTAKKHATKPQPPPVPYESSELSSARSNIVQLDDAPTQDADDESLIRVQDWRDRVLAEIPVNATPTNYYPSQTEPASTPSKVPTPEILNDDASSELSPPPESPLIVTPIRQKKTVGLKDSSVQEEELPPQPELHTPGAGQAMLLPVIDLSPHAIRLFEETYLSRESSKASPFRQPLQGSPLKNCTPAPTLLVQPPLEEPSTTRTPADVGSAVTTTTERLPGSTQTDGSFRFRKTRQKQRDLPLRKRSRLSSVLPSNDDSSEKRNQPNHASSEIRTVEPGTVDIAREDQNPSEPTSPTSSNNDGVVNLPEPEPRIVTQEVQPETHVERSKQCAADSPPSRASQIDGVTLVPLSFAEEDREDVSMGNVTCEKENASVPQDIAASLRFPKRLLWPKPGTNATNQSSQLTVPLDSAPAPTLLRAKKPKVPESEQAAAAEQHVAEMLATANAGMMADDTIDDDVVKSGPEENEEDEETAEASETEKVTVLNMALKPEPEEYAPQPPRQPIMLVSALLDPEVFEPKIPEPGVPEPQVSEPAVLAPTPALQPKLALESEVVSAPTPDPIPEPRTITSPGSLVPAVNGLMAEIAHRASQGLNAIRRALDPGAESSGATDSVAITLGAEAVTVKEEPIHAAPCSSLSDETASSPSSGIATPEMALDHAKEASGKARDEPNSPATVAKEAPGIDAASEVEEMDIDTETVVKPEVAQEVTETAHEREPTSISSHRSSSPVSVEQSPWATDTVSLPLAINIETPVPGRIVALTVPDSCQLPVSQSPWARGDSQLQVIIPPAPEIRSFVPFSSPANSAVLQRPETPPPQIFPSDTNNSQASIAQLSTPESNKPAQRTPENTNSFGLSTKSFRDFMTPSPQPAKRRKISGMSSARNNTGPISSTQLLFQAATANPWSPGLLSSSRRPTPNTIKPKSLLRQTLSTTTTPSMSRKRKRVTFAPLPGETSSALDLASSPYFSAEYPSTTPSGTPITPIVSSPHPKTRPSSPPPSTLSSDLPIAETEKFSKHFAKVATKRLGHTTFANPVAKLRDTQKRLLPSESQQGCDSPGVEAMAERFVFFADSHNNSGRTAGVEGGEEEEEEEVLLQSQLDSQLGIVIEDEEEVVEGESQDVVNDVLQNLDDFLGVGGGLWDVDSAVRDMAREQRHEEEGRRMQEEEEEMRRLEMGLGGSVWE